MLQNLCNVLLPEVPSNSSSAVVPKALLFAMAVCASFHTVPLQIAFLSSSSSTGFPSKISVVLLGIQMPVEPCKEWGEISQL